jgi:DNA-binding transcriptional LysR family regulator
MVLKSKVEIAVATGPSHSAEIESQPYREEDIVFFGSIHEPFTGGKEVGLSDLRRIPLIVRRGTTGNSTTDQILEDRGFTINVVMHCDSPDALKTAVRKGMGLGILHRDLVRTDLQKGEFREVRVKGFRLEGRSYILHLKETPPLRPCQGSSPDTAGMRKRRN